VLLNYLPIALSVLCVLGLALILNLSDLVLLKILFYLIIKHFILHLILIKIINLIIILFYNLF